MIFRNHAIISSSNRNPPEKWECTRKPYRQPNRQSVKDPLLRVALLFQVYISLPSHGPVSGWAKFDARCQPHNDFVFVFFINGFSLRSIDSNAFFVIAPNRPRLDFFVATLESPWLVQKWFIFYRGIGAIIWNFANFEDISIKSPIIFDMYMFFVIKLQPRITECSLFSRPRSQPRTCVTSSFRRSFTLLLNFELELCLQSDLKSASKTLNFLQYFGDNAVRPSCAKYPPNADD